MTSQSDSVDFSVKDAGTMQPHFMVTFDKLYLMEQKCAFGKT